MATTKINAAQIVGTKGAPAANEVVKLDASANLTSGIVNLTASTGVSASYFMGYGGELTGVSSDSVDVADSTADSEFRLVAVADSGNGVALVCLDENTETLRYNASTGRLSGSIFKAGGSITAGSSFIIGSADLDETDMEKLDGITNGTAAAAKAVVLDASKNIATLGTVGCGAITSTGASTFGSVGGATTISGSGLGSHGGGLAAGYGSEFTVSNAGALVAASLDSSGDLTVGSITMAEFTVDSSGNTDIDGTLNVEGVPTFQAAAVFSGGITTANAIAGATTVSGSGLGSHGAGLAAGYGSEFTVSSAGAVVAASLNNSAGGITNAGSIAGATSISGTLTLSGNALTIGGSYGLSKNGAAAIASMASNWTNAGRTVADAGILTTVDINGGTLGGFTVDGGWTAASQTCADLGTVTTAIVNGGDLDALNLGARSAVDLHQATLSLSGAVMDVAADSLVFQDAGDDSAKMESVAHFAGLMARGTNVNGIQSSGGEIMLSWGRDTFTSASILAGGGADDVLVNTTMSLGSRPVNGPNGANSLGQGAAVYFNGQLLRSGSLDDQYDYYFSAHSTLNLLRAVDSDDVVEILYLAR